MAVLTLEGIVRDGRIEIREDVKLAENARVYVIVPDGILSPPPRLRSPRLADIQAATAFVKKVTRVEG